MPANDRTQVSLRVPNELLADLEKIAVALDRDRSWVMLRAMRSFLEGEGAVLLGEADGVAELNRGEGVDLDEVLAEARTLLGASRAAQTRKIG